jgi:hypothetical protein
MKENISHRPLQATRAGAARLLSIFASRQKSLLTLAIIFAASFAVETICAAEPVIGILPKTIIGDVFMKKYVRCDFDYRCLSRSPTNPAGKEA